ncbi:alpha/beta hydrolase fold domain-containing protein [Micromonospora sp. NEAU-HG-1]|nr:alpha/beta hydrolase fold domain-containing protein [Micromonospora rubida]
MEVVMTYPFDTELAPWAPMLPILDLRDPAAAREVGRAIAAQLPQPDLTGLTVLDRTVPGPAGAPAVPVRIYTPQPATAPAPAVLHLHGGGFVLGDLALEHADAAAFATGIGAVVIAVDYRLAPEEPFPAALEDCYAVLCWLAGNTDELGVDPTRLGLYGRSSGGGIAAGLTLLTRDRGGPRLAMQYLDVPVLDDQLDSVSMRAYVDTPIWNRPSAELGWAYYLGDDVKPGDPSVSPYAAPARAEDLAGLPPAFISSCQFDPVRDEGMHYAQRLAQAGVPTEAHLYPATFHGSALVTEAAVSRRMQQDAVAAFRRML